MCDVFTTDQAIAKLEGKTVLFLGDSIMRNIYKDLICLTTSRGDGEFLQQIHMQRKGEETFFGDKLIEHDSSVGRGRSYIEERYFYDDEVSETLISFVIPIFHYINYFNSHEANYIE